MADNRPNILLIMADQFRTASMTGLGDGIQTPNIDRIREKAMFFPKAACTAPLCTPSRASLATGKMPSRCGVIHHDANLPKDQITYYQLLREAGYRVAVTGKTDLHKQDKTLGTAGPLPIAYHLGFTDPQGETEGKMNCAWFGRGDTGEIIPKGPYQRYLSSRCPEGLLELQKRYIELLTRRPRYYAEPTPLSDEFFLDNYIGQLAQEYLQTIDDETPWHLFVSFAGPHNPWDPPRSEVERLGNKQYPPTPADSLEGKPAWIRQRAAKQSGGMTEADLQNTKRHYDAAIQVIDQQIGRILDLVEQRGMADNTVIIFSADHGELMGDHGLFEKTAMYEGALRVPLLIHLPGMTSASESPALVSLMDLAPTILDLAGADYAPARMDAVSLLPVLANPAASLRPVQLSELQNTHMLFDGRYKWIRNFNDRDELYDLQEDPNELHNILSEHPDIIKRLSTFTFRQ